MRILKRKSNGIYKLRQNYSPSTALSGGGNSVILLLIDTKEGVLRRVYLVLGVLMLLYGAVLFPAMPFHFGVLGLLGLGAAALIVGGFYKLLCRQCEKGIFRVFKWMVLAGLMVYFGGMAALGLYGYLRPAPPTGAKAIIVLGAQTVEGKPGEMLRQRLDKALEYYTQNPGAVLVVTGGICSDSQCISDAVIMSRYLEQKGVPSSQILLEDRSYSTRENFLHSRTVLEKAGIVPGDKTVYVTNYFHLLRAGLYAKLAGFTDAHPLGTGTTPSLALPVYIREMAALIDYGRLLLLGKLQPA